MCVEILKTTLVTKGPTMGESGGGGYGYRSEKYFRSARESEYLFFFVSRSNIMNPIFFKSTPPPHIPQVKWSFPKVIIGLSSH